MVEDLLDTNPASQTTTALLSAGFLRVAGQDISITEAVASGEWDIVVLQGQEISQSHTIAYSQDEAIALAKMAIAAGSRPLFFSEWSRKNIDETQYIEGIYIEMADKAGAEVIPVGRAWDLFLVDQPDYPLWSSDGNHSSPDGAFLAAATIAYFIAGSETELTTEPSLQPFLDTALITIEDYMGD
jgi:hypothetical protein